MYVEVICEVSRKEAQKVEEELIKLNDTVKRGYNDTYVGGGGDLWYGKRDTQEYAEFLDHMSKINVGSKNPMFGKTHKKKTLQLLKEKAKGRFSLPWFQDKYGIDEGQKKWEERRQFLKNRPTKRNKITGQFV